MPRPLTRPSGTLVLLTCASLTGAAQAQIPAFPGAQGYGGYATGGRGGDVYTVTNLNSSGAGSFADAIATVPAAGRTIVFAVSGWIHLPSGSSLRLTASKVTIAGQTAPGDGIGFKDGTFRISGDDIVVRHVRFRYRDQAAGGDCVDLDSGSLNCVLDHISMQFSTDENISSFGSPPENLTMQWALNGWGLEPHSCGGLWDQNHATCHHSLWAHNHTRNPKARPNGLLDWVNNVTFDWDIGFIMGDSQTPAAWKANVRNSYFVCPPGNVRSKALEKASLDRNGVPNFSLYLNNCRHDSNVNGVLDGTDKGYSIASGSYTTLAAPVAAGGVPVTMDDPTVAFKKIVSAAGALRLDVNYAGAVRDEVDAKMVQNLVTQTAQHITNESATGASNGGIGTLDSAAAPVDSDKDGMPDFYETALGWNPALQDHNTALASSGGVITGTTFLPAASPAGYTRLEEYLHYLAIPHGSVARSVSGTPTSLTVNLAKFTAGFSAAPVFSTSNVTGGTVSLNGAVATFYPAMNYSGRARFDFTVTDSAGHSWTQTCAVLVSNAALPRDLTWKGAGNTWDNAALNWLQPSNGSTVAFSTGDRVAFTQSGIAQPAVTVSGTQTPGSMDLDATGNYTFSGTGSITSNGELTKRGLGTLTLSHTGGSQFTKATLAAGTLTLGNSGALSSTPLTLEGGTWNIGGNAPTGVAINAAGAATITGGSGSGGTGIGAIAGSAPLTIAQTNVFDLRGDMTAYSGTVSFTGNSQIRFNGSTGSPLATFNLAGSTSMAKRTTVGTVTLGALAGGADSTLQGSTGNTSATTFLIGSNHASTTFAGDIVNGGGTTGITKSGTGVLTLTGISTYTGATAISAGELIVNGSLGNTPVTIASGAKLRGAGSIAGSVTAQSGSQISPGAATGLTGTLTTGAGLSFDSATLSLQLSASPAGVNDRVIMTGGNLSLSGTTTLLTSLTDGTLGAGVYELISGGAGTTGSTANLAWTPPASGRQTFALSTPPGKLLITVTGNPGSLRWLGTGTTWDAATPGWASVSSGVNPDTFVETDAVLFDDTATSGNINVTAPVAPRSVTFNNTTRAYTLAGSPVNCPGMLIKNGTGTLTLNNANTFTGGVAISAGTVILGNTAANEGALGGGTVTMSGGTLRMYSAGDATSAGTLSENLNITGNATLETAPRGVFSGKVTGNGTLNYKTTYVRADISGDWSDFTGTVNVITDAGGGDFRIIPNYSWPGLPAASVYLNPNIWFYFNGISAQGAGTTIEIGELAGAAGSHFRGGVTGGRALTWRVGGKTPAGSTATFLGTIEEQNTSTLTNIVKTGAGRWTIRDGSWSGGTVVESGILEITGACACASATEVAGTASLILTGGSIDTDVVNLDPAATLQTTGTSRIIGELNNRGIITVLNGSLKVDADFFNTGTIEVRAGASLQTPGDVTNDGTLRILSGATLNATGTFTNNGLLDLLTSAGTLPASFINNGTVILNTDRKIRTATRTGNNFTLTVQGYAGHSYQLQRADSPAGPWTNTGSPQSGTGTTLTFTHSASNPRGFYRITVTP